MAIYRYDRKTNARKKLTNQQIKRETMLALGLDPSDADDQKEYRRQYDIIRKKVKNYNQITPDAQPLAANEVFYRIQQRKLGGADLTAEQQNILNTPALNTGTFKRQLETGQRNIIELTLANQGRIFNGLLSKWDKGREDYNNWLNEVVQTNYIDTSTGEIITPAQAADLPEDAYIIETVTRRQALEDPQEIIDFFNKLADSLHAKQKAVYNANKSAYPSGWRSTGT